MLSAADVSGVIEAQVMVQVTSSTTHEEESGVMARAADLSNRSSKVLVVEANGMLDC